MKPTALGVACACAWLAGCSSPPVDTRKQIQELSEEVTLGRGIASSLLGKFHLDRSSTAQTRYLSLVGTALARQFGRPELEFRFGILKDGPVNAYACPGGIIFLTRALLDRLKSEDELGVVLAHEIAHVNLGHVYQKLKKPKQVSFGATLSRMLSQGGGDLGMAVGQAVKEGFALLVEEGLGPALEAEADEAALAYAMSAGFDSGALYRFLARTEDSQGDLPKSHPRLDVRLGTLRGLLASNGQGDPAVPREPLARRTRFRERMEKRL